LELIDLNFVKLLMYYCFCTIVFLTACLLLTYQLYQDLVHCSGSVDLDLEGVDHIVSLPSHMSAPVLYIELAALMMKLGNRTTAGLLLKENYDRIKKYNYTGWNADAFNNIMLNSPSFEVWFRDYRTFKALGDFFKLNHNMFSASEMYAMAGSIVGE
jgi:hypothetical protein